MNEDRLEARRGVVGRELRRVLPERCGVVDMSSSVPMVWIALFRVGDAGDGVSLTMDVGSHCLLFGEPR